MYGDSPQTLLGYSEFFPFCDGLAAVKSGSKWGFIDEEGIVVIPFKYDSVLNNGIFCEGLLAVCEKGKFGFIDRTGKTVIPMKYEYYVGRYVCEFNDGVAPVGKDGKIIFIDKNGQELFTIEEDYFFVSGFCDGFAYVTKACDNHEILSGLINKKGHLITPIEYQITGLYKEGLIAVKKDGHAQYINKYGETIIDTTYEFIGDFDNHLAVVMNASKKFGIINTDGDVVIELKYDALSNVITNDIVFFREGATCGFMRLDASVVLQYPNCTSIQLKEETLYIIEYDDGKKKTEVDLSLIK